MTKLEEYLFHPRIDFPDDVAFLKERIVQLSKVPDELVQKMYRDFSEDMYCANWLYIKESGTIDEFRQWLSEEISEIPWG